MNICFIMYPWERVEPGDSTLRLIHECALRGHTVGIVHSNNLTIRDTVVYAYCKMVVKADKVTTNIPTWAKKVRFRQQMLPLRGFDAIFLRDNPPLDLLMVNFLDSIKGDVLVINDVDGIRKANNKIYPASLDDPNHEYIPSTHVSKNKDYLREVIKESKTGKMILKPLDGYGGSGVIILERGAMKNINSLLDFYIGKDHQNYVILQEYVEGADKGDVRVLMLNGEPIGAFRRVPAPDDNRSNLSAGGSMVKHVLTKQEKKLCKRLGKQLVKDGLYFCGLDLIGGKLIEVNVCSPGGLTAINRLNRTKLQVAVIDFIEEEVNAREAALNRKRAFRQTVADA